MRAADFTGHAGRAWRVASPTPAMVAAKPDISATLGVWLVTVPGAHPLWHSYFVGCVHLRPIEGVEPAALQYPEAQHEIIVYALNPDRPLPDPDDVENFRPAFLTPVNLAFQFSGAADEQARAIAEGLVRSFVDGINSPDTDWTSRTEASLRTTVEHVVTGGHGEPT